MQPLIVDAHQDLAYNILNFKRDYIRSVEETRQLEQLNQTPAHNGDTLLGWPEYQIGRVGMVFATLFAPPQESSASAWEKLSFSTPDQAYTIYRRQLDLYRRLADEYPDKFCLVTSKNNLEELLADWDDPSKNDHPVGLTMLMESAEAIRRPEELEEWWASGLRIIGLAWAGTRFCGGTRDPGPLTPAGIELLEAMADMGFLLDLSHMDSQAALQALERYPGQIIASHANAERLLDNYDGNRHLPDEVIYSLLERDGVIGIVPFNSFLVNGWRRGDNRGLVTLDHVAAQIDYICQIAGSAQHVGIGSDFDGGFGVQSVPVEIDTVADLQKIVPVLLNKGYTQDDIAAVLGGNWLRKLRSVLPEDS